MGKAGKKYEYKKKLYDSQEEIWFAYWLEELKEKGFVKTWERNENSFTVTPPVYSSYKEKNKTKTQTNIS